jgi:hypothetical protein
MTHRSAVGLAALLVATNVGWAVATFGRSPPGGDGDSTAEVAALREEIRSLKDAAREAPPALAGSGAAPASAGSPAPPSGEQKTDAQREAARRREEVLEQQRRWKETQEKAENAQVQVNGWKGDIAQVTDPERRERGLAALESGIRSKDPFLASASMRGLHVLRDIAYDATRFGPAVRSRIDDADARVRGSAIGALALVGPTPQDLDRVLDVLEAHPEDPLIQAAFAAGRRVEGRLAQLYVRALRTRAESGKARDVANVANDLRNMWVSEELEQALLDAWEKNDSEPRAWWPILGQVRPTRERRVRVIFGILEKDDTQAPQFLDRALEPQNLEGEAVRRLVADHAVRQLPTAPNAMIRRLMLRVLRGTGTREHADAVRAYADNEMVDLETRQQAGAVADELERR